MRTEQLGNCVLALGVMLSACSANVGDESSVEANVPTPSLGLQGLGAGAGTGPAVTPNSEKYKDAGKRPATGRSGSANLVARALMDKNHVTDFEATTGALDGTVTPPGNIDKLQLKILDASGNAVSTQNYNGLTGGGYVQYRYTNLGHGEKLQAQTNIGGIDARRTDVVTVPVTVQYRPDLSPTNLVAPAKAYARTDVAIAATVRELKGDTGARANCVLSIDGAQVDQARGIWVDAGGAVSCAFVYNFAAVGTHAIQIAVNNVVPGDYDASNNTVAGSIEITNPNTVYYSASAYDYAFSYDRTVDYSYSSSATPDWRQHWTANGWQQGWYVGAWSPTAPQWPLKSVSYSGTTNGAAFGSVSLANQNYSWSNTWTSGSSSGSSACLQAWDSATYTWLYVCAYKRTDGTQSNEGMWSQAQHYAGDVTYHSDGYCNANGGYWGWYCGYGNYTWNYDYRSTYGGARVAMGATVDLSLNVTDANNATWQAKPVVTMNPFSYNYATGRQCYNAWWWYYGSGSYCYDYTDSGSGSSGYTYGSSL